MILRDVKSATITGKGQIAIPKHIRESVFQKGSKVIVLSYDDHIEIRPISEFLTDTAIASEKSLAETWNSPEEDEAWKDL